MKPKYKILSFILLTVICTSMFLFLKIDETFYVRATTLEVEISRIFYLHPIKEMVINEFVELSAVSKSVGFDPCATSSVIVKFNYVDDIENNVIEEFGHEFNLHEPNCLCYELNIYSYILEENITLNDLIKLNQSDLVEYVEPDYVVNILANTTNAWGLNNITYKGIDINVTKVWEKTKGNNNIIVAVIDTGVDYNHPDLKNNIWKSTREIPNNGIDDDRNGYIDDIYGWNFASENNDVSDHDSHGTHVAGIIAASNNDIGMVGVAPNVKIMPLNVFRGRAGSASSIIKAIVYAKTNGASIVNMSLTTAGYDQSLRDTMAYASDIIFVSAAGNNSQSNNIYPKYPANYDLPNNISVASIDQNGDLSSFSNYGSTTVHLAAPGDRIYSTLPNGKYGYKSGTSMATPYITGVSALIKSVYPNDTPLQIKRRVLSTVKKLNTLQGKVSSGGLVDAGKACGF